LGLETAFKQGKEKGQPSMHIKKNYEDARNTGKQKKVGTTGHSNGAK